MSHIATISELLNLSHCQYRIYDLGRKLDKLSKEQFDKIENNMQPYPFPSQGHAFIAIAFWQKKSTEPYLWFVKLPLDERGLLNQGAINHFIEIIIEALGSDLSVDPTEQQEEILKANPYHFTPAEYKLAAINSRLKRELKQPASIYFEQCQAYFSGQLNWQEWQSIGLQGIADFAERINDDGHSQSVITALPHLPPAVLQPLCFSLENQTLSPALITALIKAYHSDNNCLYLRALASSCQHPYTLDFIEQLLAQPALDDETLITLAGRCWQSLNDSQRLLQYFEHLVTHTEPALFPALFKDLVTMPELRPVVFQCMREPNRSAALAKAIGQLFNQLQA
ncbi:MAG: DUF3549 family protein [Thalassotalea sp.]